jgi:hypothetical protein
MASVRKIPLSESVLNMIQAHVKMHCEMFTTDTVYLDTIGYVPGGRTLVESHHWPVREAFEYFQNLGVGRLEGDSFKVLDPDYFRVDPDRLIVPVNFSIDERIRPDLLLMLDVYAQVFDAENRLRFFLNQKLEDKYGPDYVFYLPQHVQERIDHEKSRTSCYVIDPRKGDLEFTHFSDLSRIIVANEEFIADDLSRSVLLEKLDYLNSIRNLAAHNNLIEAAEITRIHNNCEIVRLITGMELPAIKQTQPTEEEPSSIDI